MYMIMEYSDNINNLYYRLETKLNIETLEQHPSLSKKVEFLMSNRGKSIVDKMINALETVTSNKDLTEG